MNTALLPNNHSSNQENRIISIKWEASTPPPHALSVVIERESEGFSAFALNFPGVLSEGDTFDHAIENVKDAFLAMRDAMREIQKPMKFSSRPWRERSADSKLMRIIINE